MQRISRGTVCPGHEDHLHLGRHLLHSVPGSCGTKTGHGRGQASSGTGYRKSWPLPRNTKGDEDFGPDAKLLFKASQATGDFTMRFMQYFKDGKLRLIPLISTRFLECFAETAMAHSCWSKGLIARKKLGGVDPGIGGRDLLPGQDGNCPVLLPKHSSQCLCPPCRCSRKILPLWIFLKKRFKRLFHMTWLNSGKEPVPD